MKDFPFKIDSGKMQSVPDRFRNPMRETLGMMATRIQPMCRDQVIYDLERCDRIVGIVERSTTTKMRLLGLPFWHREHDEIVRRKLIILTPPIGRIAHCWFAEENFIDAVHDVINRYQHEVQVLEIVLHYYSSSPISH